MLVLYPRRSSEKRKAQKRLSSNVPNGWDTRKASIRIRGRERKCRRSRKKERLCDHLAAELSCGVVTIGFKLGWKNKKQWRFSIELYFESSLIILGNHAQHFILNLRRSSFTHIYTFLYNPQ